jgi:hypothetical protein
MQQSKGTRRFRSGPRGRFDSRCHGGQQLRREGIEDGLVTDAPVRTHHLYVVPEAWVPAIAIFVTRTRLSALTTDGAPITSARAHRAAGAAADTVTTT